MVVAMLLRTLVESPNFLAFLVASLVLAITPGPGVVFLITQTLRQGRKGGLASLGGVAFGSIANGVAASLGLAALFAASSTAFWVVKSAGAAYLVYLGIKVLRSPSDTATVAVLPAQAAPRLFRDGFVVALFNPKTTLFFAALLPQFISPHASALGQSLMLVGVFVAIAGCTDTLYVLTASALSTKIAGRSAWAPARYLSGAGFIGLGIYAAFASPRVK
jgi:threonine/homoserine/homoserine lactone efflux protein